MNTKSNIQILIEREDIKSNFKHALNQLMESYTIKGNVFALNSRNTPVEIFNGYFVEQKEYTNLSDCIQDMNLNQAVSINEDKFILGDIKQSLSECDYNKKVVDIERLQYVR